MSENAIPLTDETLPAQQPCRVMQLAPLILRVYVNADDGKEYDTLFQPLGNAVLLQKSPTPDTPHPPLEWCLAGIEMQTGGMVYVPFSKINGGAGTFLHPDDYRTVLFGFGVDVTGDSPASPEPAPAAPESSPSGASTTPPG
jgi:hypothetical protein